MKLRSAQFVLLVLLCSSLGLAGGSALCLADDLVGSAAGTRLLHRSAGRATAGTELPASGLPTRVAALELGPIRTFPLVQVWATPHPAAHAASLQATTANARA